MATTKTLTPTKQAITLAAFTEKPDNRTNVTNDDKLADAVNALSSNKTNYLSIDAKSYEYNTKDGLDYAYGQIPDNFSGVVKIDFKDNYRIVCTVYKQNSNWGSIIGHANSNHIPFFYTVNSGTSTLDGLALNSKTVKYTDLGSFGSESDLQTALNTALSSMENFSSLSITFSMSASTDNFRQTRYAGTLGRGSSATYAELLVQSMSSASSMTTVSGSKSTTWEFDTLAKNSNVMTVIQGSNGSIDYFKVGKIVFVKINAVELTESNKWITVGVLPEGYRPASMVNFLCYDNTVVSQTVAYTAIESRCASDGAVTVWPYRENSKPTGSFMFVLT